jgi:hypothetical protein
MLAKAQASAKAICEHQNSSPSPTTILKSVNNSGNYMCSQRIEMPSPTVKYHEIPSPLQLNHLPNMVEHRNNYNNNGKNNLHQYEYEEIEENNSGYPQFYNPAQAQQQQADQHTIELRMNNLGNENTG